jgi:hypothetical protein
MSLLLAACIPSSERLGLQGEGSNKASSSTNPMLKAWRKASLLVTCTDWKQCADAVRYRGYVQY